MTTNKEVPLARIHGANRAEAFPWEADATESRDLDSDSTRGRLVASAIEVFRKNGYEGAKVGDIARRAGLTTGAIYSTFGSKDALLSYAVWTASGKAIDEPLYNAVGAPVQALERLRMVIGDILHAPNRELHVESVFAIRRSQAFADIAIPQGQVRAQRLVHLLAEAQKNGEIRHDLNVDALALYLLSTLSGVALLAIGRTIECSEDDWKKVIDTMIDNLRPQNGSADHPSPAVSPVTQHPTEPGESQ
ncbi:TetR/AcrR family transcriptional regulator [Subtercola lobariae]|uniref:TetR family transcriptional regulator n=1 Tax=Subtercola lobariae TaxID=1588641 RepID=A0A917EVL5_9MICO|nr:TetR/AcrR family transcriptional regulator [Subtercola lobariae]GGF22700.1 TetR family transcriptional regulator [Subtercola lobariae]